ncbi:glycerol acyltransferase [Mangrovimonas yunxiaonensis]|uniref:Glycerol acyltransferase n=1 Tax=Mangrovimonas yunxiaonensis TaxID=1197477 RepID=A0A084TKC2_9FLAO|nr:lysophospholipid acyltransferase family protein [Mangrovimonas yunxiaonensis]KFB01158.1 glycerol acyltransferase [Mangrovimonas yunxiaonensis]MBR9757976.1 1-acyl-sn-glycerol-3-phosphate acyltransferase [Algicola sp.]
MLKFLSYPLTFLFFICFGIALLVFHPLQWISLNVFGYQAHKKTVDWLQFFLMRCTNLLGARYTFKNPYNITKNQPVIIVANHQSMYDIPPIIWYMRKYHPKFISKKELGKGIPSVSFNLKYGGSALIDRKNPKAAVETIQNFANYIKTNNRAAVIFPEGTRSRTGKPKTFQKKGLITLFKGIPNAVVVPITINNSWKMLRYGKFPMGLGAHLKFKVHQPIQLSDYNDYDTLIAHLEKEITKDVVV